MHGVLLTIYTFCPNLTYTVLSVLFLKVVICVLCPLLGKFFNDLSSMSQFMCDLFHQMAGGGGKCKFYWQTCTAMWVIFFERITVLYWNGVVSLCSKQQELNETSCREIPIMSCVPESGCVLLVWDAEDIWTDRVTEFSITQPLNWLQVSRCLNRVAVMNHVSEQEVLRCRTQFSN